MGTSTVTSLRLSSRAPSTRMERRDMELSTLRATGRESNRRLDADRGRHYVPATMQYVDPALPRQVESWTSPRLGMEMPIVTYGDRGHPLLLLPTAAADFLEN